MRLSTQPAWRHSGVPRLRGKDGAAPPGERSRDSVRIDPEAELRRTDQRVDALTQLLEEEARRQQGVRAACDTSWRPGLAFQMAELQCLRPEGVLSARNAGSSSPALARYAPTPAAAQASPRAEAVHPQRSPRFAQRFSHTGAADPTVYDGWLASSPRIDVAKLPRQAPRDPPRPMAQPSNAFFAPSDLVRMLEHRLIVEPPGLPGFPPLLPSR